MGRVGGTIEVGNERIAFEGKGNRDHSMGPRELGGLKNHQWLQGYFDNGISFLVYDAVLLGNVAPVFCEAVVYEGDKLFDGKLEYTNRIESVDDAKIPYGFKIHYKNGALEIRVREFVSTAYLSATAPSDMYVGVVQAGPPAFTLVEQTVRLELNGATAGFGNWERTVSGVLAVEV